MTLQLRVIAYCIRGYNEEIHTFTNALNDLLCFAAAWTQLKCPLLMQLSSSIITVHSVLHLQKQSDTNGDPTIKANDKFKLKRVSIPLTNENDSCYLHVIESVGTRKVIKSDKSGSVSLGKEDKFGACWIRIKPTSSCK